MESWGERHIKGGGIQIIFMKLLDRNHASKRKRNDIFKEMKGKSGIFLMILPNKDILKITKKYLTYKEKEGKIKE